MIKHFLTKQFLKFLLVGGSAAGVNWVARLIIDIWTTFSTSVIIAYIFGMITAFILNKTYVFPDSNRDLSKQARDFIITNLVAFPIVWILSILFKNILKNYLGLSHYTAEIAHFLALSAPIIISFLIYKFIAFKKV